MTCRILYSSLNKGKIDTLSIWQIIATISQKLDSDMNTDVMGISAYLKENFVVSLEASKMRVF